MMTQSLSLKLQIKFLLGFLVSSFFLPSLVFAAGDFIPLYEVDITLNQDSSFRVDETIYYDFGRNYRHGITRDIPTVHPQESTSFLKNRYSQVDLLSILMDDNKIEFQSTENNEGLFLKIGNPNQTLTTEHKYSVSYVVKGGLHYFEEQRPELYWDAIGTEWAATIGKAVVKINDEHSLLTGVATCYIGTIGSNERCADFVKEGSTYTYTVETVGTGRGVTVALAAKDSAPVVILEKYNIWYFVIPSGILIFLAVVFGLYRYRTEFKVRRTIIPQYEPYQDLKPMYLGVLKDDSLHPADVTAGIVYLAQQGYLKIKKTSKKVLFFFEVDDYEITLSKTPGDDLSDFQKDVLELLFSNATQGESLTLSQLKVSHSKQRENQKILKKLRRDLKKDLVAQRYFQSKSLRDIWPMLALGAGVIVIAFIWLAGAGVYLALMGFLVLAFLRRRTRKGYEALNHLKGFKQFLEVTEKERYKFHNSPQKSPQQFMEFLPYAIAFGVEKEWAETFKDITIADPDWYDGGNAGSFSATNLTTSLGAFSTAFATSSGSSGSSGSGGGGSVGGGGGGGGGGGW